MHALAFRTALATSIAMGEAQRTAGLLVVGRLTNGSDVPLGPAGNELKPDEMPVFRLSTDGEAEDGNILDQEWDLSRAELGIAPILLNHTIRNEAPLGLGVWRSPVVVTEGGGRELRAQADFSRDVPMAVQALAMIRSGHLRSVSVGWRPGFRTLRGDLPADHKWYRAPMTDDCGTRIEGYVMGRADQPNRLMEASVTPLPSDPAATSVGARLASGERSVVELAAGGRVSGVDIASALLVLRDNPSVQRFLSIHTASLEARIAALEARATSPVPGALSIDDILGA